MMRNIVRRIKPFLLLVFFGFAANVFSFAAPHTSLLLQAAKSTPDTDSIKKDTIRWSKDRKLRFSDFNIEDKIILGATASSIDMLGYDAFPLNDTDTTTYHIVVTASFLEQRSWIWEMVDTDSVVLAHEQGHFDLTEIYARLLRKTLAEERLDTFSAAESKQCLDKIESLYQRYRLDLIRLEYKYDHEIVGPGGRPFMQEEWYRRIADDLKALEKYASQ